MFTLFTLLKVYYRNEVIVTNAVMMLVKVSLTKSVRSRRAAESVVLC